MVYIYELESPQLHQPHAQPIRRIDQYVPPGEAGARQPPCTTGTL
jgi:hypothetical protein